MMSTTRTRLVNPNQADTVTGAPGRGSCEVESHMEVSVNWGGGSHFGGPYVRDPMY